MPNNDWQKRMVDELCDHYDMNCPSDYCKDCIVFKFLSREIEAARKEEREKARKLAEALQKISVGTVDAEPPYRNFPMVMAREIANAALKEYEEGK